LAREISRRQAAEKLEVTLRSVKRYLRWFRESGPEGLYDHRRSNYEKITEKDERQIVLVKLQGRHRSARLIRDLLKLSVHEDTVRRVLIKNHLERTSLPPVKPIRRFRANEPNDLWQIDIQGKVYFPLIGDLLLILVKDDHSRFLLSGRCTFISTRSTCLWCRIRLLSVGDFLKRCCWTEEVNSKLLSSTVRRSISPDATARH